jgi:hypothetical protein
MIWRLLVRSESILANLHYILQMAMGWEGYHLHHFIIRGKRYGIPQPGGLGFPDDSTQVRLADLRPRLRERFHILPDLSESSVFYGARGAGMRLSPDLWRGRIAPLTRAAEAVNTG